MIARPSRPQRTQDDARRRPRAAGPARRRAVSVRRASLRGARAAALALLAALALPHAATAGGHDALGPFGPEGPRMREQLWLVPSADAGSPLRATVFRPAEDATAGATPPRRPLVVINHGTSEATRLSVAMPVYYWLSRWFVDRGYVVLLPQRRGHGATGGSLVEGIGTCADPDHYRSGLAAAADIEAAVAYMARQPFVAPDATVVVGVSSGGWASLALAARKPEGVRAVVSFAGGRGGRAFGRTDGTVCGERRLIAAARAYGAEAHMPTLWLYAENDSYFRPRLARALAGAWQAGGGAADLHVFAPYGADGHALADDRAGWDVWGATLDAFLAPGRETPVAQAPQAVAADAAPATAAVVSVSDGSSADKP